MEPTLFDDAESPPCQRHSPTSREAAETIAPKAGTLRALLLAWLRERGEAGATDEEQQEGTGLGPSTQRPRRIELVAGGWVVDSGRTRKTRAGRKAVVWIVSERLQGAKPGSGAPCPEGRPFRGET